MKEVVGVLSQQIGVHLAIEIVIHRAEVKALIRVVFQVDIQVKNTSVSWLIFRKLN